MRPAAIRIPKKIPKKIGQKPGAMSVNLRSASPYARLSRIQNIRPYSRR